MANLRKRRKHVVTNQQTNSTSKATTKEVIKESNQMKITFQRHKHFEMEL